MENLWPLGIYGSLLRGMGCHRILSDKNPLNFSVGFPMVISSSWIMIIPIDGIRKHQNYQIVIINKLLKLVSDKDEDDANLAQQQSGIFMSQNTKRRNQIYLLFPSNCLYDPGISADPVAERISKAKLAILEIPQMGVSLNGGTPIAGWFRRENRMI